MSKKIRQFKNVIEGRMTTDGAGVKLKRIIDPTINKNLDPFILLDEFISDVAMDYVGGFPDHPHRGFETITYLLAGSMRHRDHLGHEGHLRAGGVQWMRAGRGIIHSEMPEQENGLLHGFQLWLNLPAKEKMVPPSYRDYSCEEIPQIKLADGGSIKVIAGFFQNNFAQLSGAIVESSMTKPLFLDVLLAPGQLLEVEVEEFQRVLIYPYEGEITTGIKQQTLAAGNLAELIDGNTVAIATRDKSVRCLILSANSIGEPVVHSGPFVMNSQEEIDQAYRDYRDGVLAL